MSEKLALLSEFSIAGVIIITLAIVIFVYCTKWMRL